MCLLSFTAAAHAQFSNSEVSAWYVARPGRCETLEQQFGGKYTPETLVEGFRKDGLQVEEHSEIPAFLSKVIVLPRQPFLVQFVITTPENNTQGFVLARGIAMCSFMRDFMRETGDMPFQLDAKAREICHRLIAAGKQLSGDDELMCSGELPQ
jgi:hypothetical protein